MFLDNLQNKFEMLETDTVSGSFGGPSLGGRAPNFDFAPIVQWSIENLEEFPPYVVNNLEKLRGSLNEKSFKYVISSLFRFSFCIELTNLSITSTKMKTRWLPGRIIRTRLGTFENYEGDFTPEFDQRSSTFVECTNILFKCIELISESEVHVKTFSELSSTSKRGTPYEAVFTYTDPEAAHVHTSENIRLVELRDINWLIQARPLIRPTINRNTDGNDSKLVNKIATKCYKTDRAQTGEVQTNRAKRWECLSQDYQHATIEECWSVERKLLSDLAHFLGFPEENQTALIENRLFGNQTTTLCPITFNPMILGDILGGGAHGESNFQVGHMAPLKSGGRHTGENIQWISGDGNRIQGSLSIEKTREMLVGIFQRMQLAGMI
jgi:hypothetical protein